MTTAENAAIRARIRGVLDRTGNSGFITALTGVVIVIIGGLVESLNVVMAGTIVAAIGMGSAMTVSFLLFEIHNALYKEAQKNSIMTTENKTPEALAREDIADETASSISAACSSNCENNINLILANVRSVITRATQPLEEQIKVLTEWKRQAILVIPDYLEIGKLLGVKLGESVNEQLMPKIKALTKQAEEAQIVEDMMRETIESANKRNATLAVQFDECESKLQSAEAKIAEITTEARKVIASCRELESNDANPANLCVDYGGLVRLLDPAPANALKEKVKSE